MKKLIAYLLVTVLLMSSVLAYQTSERGLYRGQRIAEGADVTDEKLDQIADFLMKQQSSTFGYVYDKKLKQRVSIRDAGYKMENLKVLLRGPENKRLVEKVLSHMKARERAGGKVETYTYQKELRPNVYAIKASKMGKVYLQAYGRPKPYETVGVTPEKLSKIRMCKTIFNPILRMNQFPNTLTDDILSKLTAMQPGKQSECVRKALGM